MKKTVFIAVISCLTLVLIGNAQTEPQFLVSWQSETYAPYDFAGKVFPTEKSIINVSFEVLENGRFANLSQNNIQWLVNGVISRGTGKKTHSFTNRKFPNDKIEIEIKVLNYKIPDRIISKLVQIPVASPEVVIKAPYNKDGLMEKEINLVALPYFFNAASLKDLNFIWTINNEQPLGEPERQDLITVTIPQNAPSGSQFRTDVVAKNTKKPSEQAIKSLLFQVK